MTLAIAILVRRWLHCVVVITHDIVDLYPVAQVMKLTLA